jgi:3-keto-L-gulonate-6-phosphate decarboxylase
MLNYLINSYSGCVDDAADLIQVALAKQENIRQGIDLMASKTKDFLAILQKYQNEGPEVAIYQENLDDAIEGTQDAQNDAEKAKKKAAPPPVRRKN